MDITWFEYGSTIYDYYVFVIMPWSNHGLITIVIGPWFDYLGYLTVV